MLAAIQKWAGAIGFWLIAIVLFFWTFFENFGVSYERLLSIAMALFGGLIIYFDGRFNAVLTREKSVTKLTISQGTNRVFQSTARIRHLRIAALTGEMITPLFTGHEIKIDEATLLFHEFNARQPNANEFRERVDWTISEWKKMRDQRKATKVNIAKYAGVPNSYVIIIDTIYMIFGPYYPDEKSPTGVETGTAFFVDGATETGALIIDAWVVAFDKQFSFWQQNPPGYN